MNPYVIGGILFAILIGLVYHARREEKSTEDPQFRFDAAAGENQVSIDHEESLRGQRHQRLGEDLTDAWR